MRYLIRLLLLFPVLFASSRLIAQDDTAIEFAFQARVAASRGDSAKAVELATKALESNPQPDGITFLYYVRGREEFRIGQIAKSAADFDKYAELHPAEKPKLWERGITLYYAGRFQEGADQFALYQKYLSNDVENAAWRFLCMAQADGVDKAQAELLPIEGDGRIPMMTLHRFYRGAATEEEVLKAVEAGEASEAERAGRRFYADLYLGLYYEAIGDDAKAKPFLKRAASPDLQKTATGAMNSYMGDVARIHWQRLQQPDKSSDEESAGSASQDSK
ncbi:hypothetical protein LOC68_26700 [Blastopirellula sp. JC732]|uniref:Lipoprotein NlpI n=1 Tax=Blastopirellula sediminis TaxID=2894196 RepID=A0A9X1MSE2_9BACT|nr:hypothetical protein [Blastopirellula sediminis]MCC9604700.1 hypothetical protein [Blastopirellula sediminis]MCC9632001.1 hypothetical protein [Blastopirellula sediminis]